ncbi:hypothetical protein GCM10025865_03100 [Paraoerskovia sediminicola]|uniref:Uncharacterized protein n=1 Tax=Paraoerskovia sediminicola TaxID=1138587 RepID=A0ABM8FZ26_9CELL|nr:PPA1309 family protein [Paraoerskovia sediminicola]BDZ41011.1 hypothetical protein GCM10025865_03100 [Paraoerskovia sediminicola]
MTDEPSTPSPHTADGPQTSVTAAQIALAEAVREIEQHVSSAGWDGPVRLFALVDTAGALAADPSLAERLPADVVETAATGNGHLTSVEQELAEADDLEALLARIGWPDSVDGAALVVERIVLPPEAEQDVPGDPEAALAFLSEHPSREDVRIAVGVLRDGSAWCGLRSRSHDDDTQVAFGSDLVPGLVEALAATLRD